MNKKEPDEEFKAFVFMARWGHGWRKFVKRSERDRDYCTKILNSQIILGIMWWEIIVEKRQQIAGGVMAGAGAFRAATSQILAASQWGVDRMVHGKSYTEATTNMDNAMQNIKADFKQDLDNAQYDVKKVVLDEKKEKDSE